MIKKRIKLWREIPKEVCGDIIEKYKEYQDDYYTLILFDNCEDMYRYYDRRWGKKEPCEHNYDGMAKYYDTSYYEDYECTKLQYRSKACGVIMLSLEDIGTGVVSHEVCHAVLFYLGHRLEEDCNKVFENEGYMAIDYNELACYMTGHLNKCIWNTYYLIKDNKSIDK